MTEDETRSQKPKHPPVTRKGIVTDLRRLADLAEESGDRRSAVRALKIAAHIERHSPANPIPPSIDRIIELSEAMGPLVCRFLPEDAASFAATVADLRQCRMELVEAERENATIH